MEKVDQDYLDAIISSQNNSDSTNDNKCPIKDPMEVYEEIQEEAINLGKRNAALDMEVIMKFLQVMAFSYFICLLAFCRRIPIVISCFQLLLTMWNNQLNSLSPAEKTGTKGKLAMATYNQTQIYLKPLFRKLKSKKLPEDILDSLTTIVKHLLDRNYIMVSNCNFI